MPNQRRENLKRTNLVIKTATNNAIKCSSNDKFGNPKETLSHRIVKFWLANYCWDHGIQFATEAVFKNNQRGDFVVKEWFLDFEILGSETKKSFLNKSYPINTIPVSVNTTPEQITDMMKDLDMTSGGTWDFYLKKNLNAIHN